jgi:protein ImuB
LRAGLQVRAVIAGTPDAARALARFGRIGTVPNGQDEAFVGKLPVAALANVEHETVIALSRAGLKTIGHLANRPPQVLAARFGQSLVTQVMRTLGREDARLTPYRPLPAVAVEQRFAEPLSQVEALEGVLALLIEKAVLALQERGEGGRAFEASLFRSDGDIRRLTVETGRPCREAATILKLYRERLAALADPIDAGFGFDVIRLAVPVAEPLGSLQSGLGGDATEDEAVDTLIDRLVVRFGRNRVLKFEPQDTHDPDREARLVPASDRSGKRHCAATRRISWLRPEPGEPPIRPLHLFDPPQPIEALAEVPDGPPLRFRWRRILHDVKRAEGPERIAPEWWRKKNGEPRDYYRVEDAAGCRFWIFRQGLYRQDAPRPRWFMHGVFA